MDNYNSQASHESIMDQLGSDFWDDRKYDLSNVFANFATELRKFDTYNLEEKIYHSLDTGGSASHTYFLIFTEIIDGYLRNNKLDFSVFSKNTKYIGDNIFNDQDKALDFLLSKYENLTVTPDEFIVIISSSRFCCETRVLLHLTKQYISRFLGKNLHVYEESTDTFWKWVEVHNAIELSQKEMSRKFNRRIRK